MRKNHIVIIDGKNLLWRNADAFSELTAYVDGEDINTGGMYGFVAGLIRIHARYRGRVIIAWEGKNNFRFDLYPQYKNRDKRTKEQFELAEEVKGSEGRLNEFLSFAGVRQFYGVGCEADDVMGTIAIAAKKKGLNSIIYTGDSDLRQLVDSNILVASPSRGGDIVYDKVKVKQKHGVIPGRLPILKALAGDSSDNIPGLTGIGEKTAASLVSLYGSLGAINIAANILESNDWPVSNRFKEIVWNGRKDSELFLKLTTIKTDAKLKAVPVCKDKKEVIRLLKEYKFRSLSSAAELLEIMSLGV